MGYRLCVWLVASGVALLVQAPPSLAQAPCDDWAARLVSVQGRVEHKRAVSSDWVASAPDSVVCPGDALRVGADSRAAVLLPGETLVRLDQGSTMTFSEPAGEGSFLVDLLEGIGYFLSRVPRQLKVRTPFVNGAVEGTEFLAQAGPRESRLLVVEGTVAADNTSGRLLLQRGEAAVAGRGQAPRKVLVADPRDAVKWAFYYPPVVSYPSGQASPEVRAALVRFERGDTASAFAALERIPARRRDAAFHTLRASIRLFVGQVEPARQDLAKALALDPTQGTAIALQSIVALVLDRPEEALRLAEEGARLAPAAAAPLIALSYVHQSRFDLDQAWERASAATELEPGNALAWARRAELELARGNLGAARRDVEKAITLNPNLSRIQTTRGFALLLRIDVTGATTSFERAIALDQADPLPRLGLGLARIRQGRLAQGRRDIEIAATLDPGSSIVRSYLGKAYFEEKRDDLAASQYGLAKALDPKDPTPWLYDAIRKQTVNRPVEALGDLQASIERNDNRAVYRSRLLLDRDEATRAASTGRIYRDLGFEQLALVEGWKSLSLDPGNSSAHRLLADAYAELPGFRLAQVSELLQSQLRQPLNAVPIQPLLAEADTFILRGAGPSDLGFNEYNRLFVRDGLGFQANGIIGGNDIRGSDLIVNGLWGNVALSAGRSYYRTTGIRPNNDQQQELETLFAQMQLAPSTSIQAEYRTRDFDHGDLTLRFDPLDLNPRQRVEEKTRSFRVGLHHRFSKSLDMIAHFRTRDFGSDLLLPGTSVIDTSFSLESDGETAEAQLLGAFEYASFILGGGVSRTDELGTLRVDSTPFFCSFILCGATEDQNEEKHHNIHLYTHLGFWDEVRLTLGAALESYEDQQIDRSQLSPKFGLIWMPTSQTTVRAAAFRALLRPFVGDQTIEPTQVVGFNQLFAGAAGTDSRHYGVAVDHRISAELFAGAEYTHRDLKVSGLDQSGGPPVLIEEDHATTLGRAYLYWAPRPRWAVRGEYRYERLIQSEALAFNAFEEIRDHRLLLGAGYFHPSGLRATLSGTYVDQEGLFTPSVAVPGTLPVPGSDRFWTLDLSLAYQLPRRLGLVSLTVKNLFDQDFQFQDTDPANPSLLSERLVTLTASLFF